MAAEALCIVMFDGRRGQHKIANSQIFGQRAGGPNTDNRLHVVSVIDQMLCLHAKLRLPVPTTGDGDAERGEVPRRAQSAPLASHSLARAGSA